MKRRNLCRKRILAIILTAALCMTRMVTVMADSVVAVSGDAQHEPEKEKIERDSADTSDGTPAVYVSMQGGDEVTVTIKEDAAVEGDSDGQKYVAGVSALASGTDAGTGNTSKASVDIGGDVKVDSGSFPSVGDEVAVGVDSSAEDKAVTDVSAGNVDVKSTINAVGVNASAQSGASSEADVKSVTVASQLNADGVGAGAFDQGGTGVKVHGDISAASAFGDALGINAVSQSDGVTGVTVEGDVTARAAEYATGIFSQTGNAAYLDTDSKLVPASDGLTVVEVLGGVTSEASDGIASGISVATHGGTNIVTVMDTVTVTGKNDDNSSNQLNYDAVGIEILKSSDETANDSGSLTLVSTGTVDVHSYNRQAYGIRLGSDVIENDGKVGILVEGDVKAGAENQVGAGIYGDIGEGGNAYINVTGDVIGSGASSVGIGISNSKGNLDIQVDGSVIQESQQGGQAIVIYEENSQDSQAAGIRISIGEDIIADGSAVVVTKTQDTSRMDLEVQGTVSGGEHNLVLQGEGSTQNLNITVWKVDTSDNKPVAESMVFNQNTNGYEYSRNEDAEKKINYIIRVDQPADYKINLDGTARTDNGLEVAREGDTVYLNVDIPEGYKVEFFDINHNDSYSFVPNGYGGAYLFVPRGGGVQVGVTLTKIEKEKEKEKSGEGKEDSDYDKTEGSDISDRNDYIEIPEDIRALQIHVLDFTGVDRVLSVGDVLQLVDTLTAINNFAAAGTSTLGTENIMGAGVVSFNNLFSGSVTDTVDVPVSANVYIGQLYTVIFSDGTSVQVQCSMDGILNIPFTKNAEGLTYIIYGFRI